MVLTEPASEIVGQRYVLHRKLGAGGMGSVYLATDRLTGQVVALKRVPATGGSHTDSAALRLALTREFQTLASLRHPNVVGVLDYGFDELRQPYFTMTLVEDAVSLREAGWNQPVSKKINLVIQVLQALVYLHRRGVIHRDLKPDNALVTPEGEVKVLDFGLAVVRDQAKEDQYAGTLRYMAPEVIQGQTPDEAADLYSVGVMAYELLAGRHPFEGNTIQEMLRNVLTTEPDMSRIESLTGEAFGAAADEEAPSVELSSIGDFSNTPTERSLRAVLPTRPPAPPDEDTVIVRARAQQGDLSTRIFGADTFAEFKDTETSRSIDGSGNPLVVILRRLMAKRPEDRYRDARQVIDDLHRALGETAAEESSEIRESFLQAAKFVGREAEMDELAHALNEAVCGHGSVWLVGGESGVGKSRLVEEMRTLAMVQGALVLRGQAVSEGSVPYQLWRDPVRRLLLSVDVSDAEATVLKQLAPDIDRLLEREVPDSWAQDAGEAQQRLISTLVGLFERYCQHHPEGVMLILEDLQWATNTADVLGRFVPVAKTLPLLIIANYRSEEAPDLPGQVAGANLLELKRLNEQNIVELSESILGEAGRQQHVIEFLRRETEGNVFFVIEVTRALAEEVGQLERIGSLPLPERVFPGGIQAIIQRRLDHVPAAYRPLLELAAVSGRQLDLRVLEFLAGSINPDDWLTACVNAAVMDSQDTQWRFAHDKLREQVLADLPNTQRRTLHQRVAEAIETVYVNELMQHAAMLAYQWSCAGNKAKEFFYNRLAGEQAVDISAYTDAQRYYENALALLVSEGLPETQGQEIDLQIKLGDVYQVLGRYDAATEYLTAALGKARAIGGRKQTAAALMGLGWVHLRQGNLDGARRQSHEALEAIRGENDERMLVEALYLAGLIPLIEGQYTDADRYLRECLPLARRLSDPTHLANILNALGAVSEGLQHYGEAHAYLLEALEIARGIGNRFLQANAQGNLGRVAYNQKLYVDARGHFEESLKLFRDIDNVYGEANVLYFLGFIETALENDSEAVYYLHESIRRSMRIGAVTITLIALCGVARLLARKGEKERAVELLGMVLNHAASAADVDVEKEGVPMLNILGAELPGEQFEAALERGKGRELESVLSDLIDLKRVTNT